MSSVLYIPLKPSFTLYHFHKSCSLSAYKSSLHCSSSLSFSKFRIRASSSSDFDREEQRWLREEQRWLREEQRWLRDRDSLLHEISDLKLQIQALEHRVSGLGQGGADTVANIAALVQALKDKNRIAESGTGASPMVLEELEDNEVVVEEVVRVLEGEGQQKIKNKERRTLRKGAQGDEVQEMQEALQKLGFYSGEEDMEFSSFSSGTERAVKTWQSCLGAPEDGVMTAELLKKLYMEQPSEDVGVNFNAMEEGSHVIPPKKGANGAALDSLSEIQHKAEQEDGVTQVGLSQHRVFLLGENRWEDSSRLVRKTKHISKTSGTKCLTCRGEGRLLCTDAYVASRVESQAFEVVVRIVDEAQVCGLTLQATKPPEQVQFGHDLPVVAEFGDGPRIDVAIPVVDQGSPWKNVLTKSPDPEVLPQKKGRERPKKVQPKRSVPPVVFYQSTSKSSTDKGDVSGSFTVEIAKKDSLGAWSFSKKVGKKPVDLSFLALECRVPQDDYIEVSEDVPDPTLEEALIPVPVSNRFICLNSSRK